MGGAYVTPRCSAPFTKRLLRFVRWETWILMLPPRSSVSLYLTFIWLYSSNDMWWLEREATVRGRDPPIHPCNDRRSVKHSGNLVTAAKLDLKGYCKEIHPQVGGGIVGRVGKLFLVLLNASSGHNNNLNNENNKDISLNYSKHKFHLEIQFPDNGCVNHSFAVRRPPQRVYFLFTRKVKVHSGRGDWRSGPEQPF